MKKLIGLLSILAFLVFGHCTWALPEAGSCAEYNKFSLNSSGNISTGIPVRVLRHNAPIYEDANGAKLKPVSLKFGESLIPVQLSNPRRMIQVRQLGENNPLGWMMEHDLLCAYTPLLSSSALERKVFIKTSSSTETNSARIPAYSSYEDSSCTEDCRYLSRFELYFIFADDPNQRRYLVCSSYNLALGDPPPPLVGWVNFDNVIPWDTTLGVRPKETVRAFEHIGDGADAGGNNGGGIVLDGGRDWYTFTLHIPLLKIEQGHYHVAAANVGIEAFRPINPDPLASMKQVDVFFLLDGTSSMGPYIKAALRAVQAISDKLRKAPAFKETSFRFGYRVYRDNYADNLISACHTGICEGMSLLSTTCRPDNQMTDVNQQQFVTEVSTIQESHNDNDDFPEKLYDGLRRAIQDIGSCVERAKLLFVIGDHGDREAEPPGDIINSLKENFGKLLVVFIQTPSNVLNVKNPEDYKKAYDDFKRQASTIIDRILPAEYSGKPVLRSDYLLSLSDAQIPDKILSLVKQYSPSDIIDEIEQRLRNGESLKHIIEKYMTEGDMPVLYWKWVNDSACRSLGNQCENQVKHEVRDFYIPMDPVKIQEEVWMSGRSLDNWLNLLRSFDDIIADPVEKQRKEFAQLLNQQVQNILGQPPLEDNKTIGEQMMQRKNALPMREKGPFLQYTLHEITQTIQECEFTRLFGWLNSVRQVLAAVKASPEMKVSINLESSALSNCPLSEKGRKVPKMTFEQRERLGLDDNYGYGHNFRGEKIYWIPVEFLP